MPRVKNSKISDVSRSVNLPCCCFRFIFWDDWINRVKKKRRQKPICIMHQNHRFPAPPPSQGNRPGNEVATTTESALIAQEEDEDVRGTDGMPTRKSTRSRKQVKDNNFVFERWNIQHGTSVGQRKSESPPGIEPMTSRTLGRRSIHWATRTHGEQGHFTEWQVSCILLGSALPSSSWVVISPPGVRDSDFSLSHTRVMLNISSFTSNYQARNSPSSFSYHNFVFVNIFILWSKTF